MAEEIPSYSSLPKDTYVGPLREAATTLRKEAEDKRAAEKSAEDAAKAGIAPSVAPAVTDAPAINWEARAYETGMANIYGPDFATKFTPQQLKDVASDTPTWTKNMTLARERTRAEFEALKKDPDSHVSRLLANDSAMAALGQKLLYEEAEAEKNGSRTNWWKANLDMNPVAYRAYIRAGAKEGDRVRKSMMPVMNLLSWDGLIEGGGMAARNYPILKLGGLTYNRVLGPAIETPLAAIESTGDKVQAAKTGFARLVEGSKDPKELNRSKVARILSLKAKNPNYFHAGVDGSPEFYKDIKALTPVEQAEVLIGLNHQVIKDEKTGELRLLRGTDNPEQGRPLSLTDFDWNFIKDGELDERGFASIEEDRALASGQGAAGGYAFEEINNRRRTRAAKIEKGKIDPAEFFDREKGRGFLESVPSGPEAQLATLGGVGYNRFVSTFEQLGVGAAGIWNIFATNTRPNSFFWDVKTILKDEEEQIAYHRTSMERMEWEEAAFGAHGQKGLKMPLTDSVIESIYGDGAGEMKQRMRDYGYVTAATAEHGFMAFHPAMAAGQIASGGVWAATKFERAAKVAAWAGMNEERIEKILKGVDIGAQWSLAFPAKVVGFAALHTGKAVLYLPASLVKPVAKIGGKLIEKVGWKGGAASAEGFAKKSLLALGFTDAFVMGGFGRQLALAWTWGKGMEAGGHLMSKYFDSTMDGYGFRGVMKAASLDSTISPLARGTAKFFSEGGIITKWTWDVGKGMYGGAGAMYSMAVMKGDHLDGMNSVAVGAGMGGLNSGLHGGHDYVRGRTHHNQAMRMMEAEVESPLIPPETRAKILEQLKAAEKNGDYEYAPRLMSTITRAKKLGITLVMADTAGIRGNANLRAGDLVGLDAADMTVTADGQTRTFKIKEYNAEVENMRLEIKKASAAGNSLEVHRLGSLLGEAQSRRMKEINEYLDFVRRSGNDQLKERVGDGEKFAGVYAHDIDGQRFIFLNMDYADSTTGGHEIFHGIQKLLGLTQAQRTFNQFAFGIKFGQIDDKGQRSETVFQKGLFEADDVLNYGINYLTRLGGSAATRDRRIAELKQAVEEMKSLGGKGLLSESSVRTIEKLGEEMGARWYENFISRKPQDYLYFGGKYGKMRQLSDKLVMYLRHNNTIDMNASGIKENLRRSAAEIQAINNRRAILERRRSVFESVVQDLQDAVNASMARGMSEQEARALLTSDPYLARKLDFVKKYQAEIDSIDGFDFLMPNVGPVRISGSLERAASSTEHGGTRDLFTDRDGNNLVVPEIDAYFEAMSGYELDGSAPNVSVNLNDMSGTMLESHLAALGLEHYGYRDASGVLRLKDRKVIDAEDAARGKRTTEILDTLPPTRSGVVKTTDKNGNTRYVGVLSDEALAVLSNDTFDHNGQQHRTMPAGLAVKTKTIRDMVLHSTDPNSTDFNVLQFLYSALSKEVDGGPRVRKPHGHVEQTFRRVLPYRMEYVLTTKDKDGNKVAPFYEMMVTGVDLNVIYRRMANEVNKNYTLPSGRVVNVKEIFGGDMAIMHDYFRRYLNELSKNNSRPTAEVFGGGELGEAIRDIMYRVLGTIPEGGHDFQGKPLAFNNPIIRPFDTWERGTDFAFTTFRVDLMSHLEQIADRIPFNDGAYGKAIGNYQPPSMTARVPLNDGASFLRTYIGDFEPNSQKDKRGKKEVNTAQYNILEANGKFIVSSDLLGRPMEFKSSKEAEDFIHLDYQRAAQLVNSGKVLNRWNLKGVAVGSTGDGKYVLIDNFNFKNRRSPNLNKLINGMSFSTYDEAFKAAANLHNTMALDALKESTGHSDSQKKLTRYLVDTQSTAKVGKEAFPLRVEIDADGTPVLEPKTKLVNGETVPDVYTEKDVEVQKGFAKAGDQKMKVAFQQMSYNWLNSLTGDANLKANDPLIKAHGRRVGKLLAKEMMKFINDPDILAGFRWYLDFSERGHKVFGNMFPVVCEALGATSARTPVKTNFDQTTEFVRKFSLGHYDAKIKTITDRLTELHNQINFVAGQGQRNEWNTRVIKDVIYKRYLSDTKWRKKNGIPDVTFAKWKANEALMPDSLRAEIEKDIGTQLGDPDYKLTPKQITDAILADELTILNAEDTILLRDGDKKFNMNSNKVTMVAVAEFLKKTDGPKTIQFSKNLMGVDHSATIDVWAARTLSRLIHNGILGNKMWRIRPSMEGTVEGKVIRLGTKNMPIMTGSGDFYLGQEAFAVAADLLSQRLGLTMKEFNGLTPANLQAMVWFAEKRVWDNNGWTGEIGAEMSSFDAPLRDIMGAPDATGVMDISHARRLLFGVSGSVNASRTIGYTLNAKGETVPVEVSARYRNYPTPSEVLTDIANVFRRGFGNRTVSMQVEATTGGYGNGLEDSIYISLNLERGNQITLANQISEVRNNVRNAENNILKKEAEKQGASPERVGKLESEIRALRKQIEKSEGSVTQLEAIKAGDASNPDALNQLPTALEQVIQRGRIYQQSDVMGGEVVGPNHPNARPMRTIRFDRPIDGEMAALLIQNFNLKEAKPSYGGVYAFTMEPDARNPNKAKIDALGKQIAVLEKKARMSGNLSERHSIESEIAELSRQVMKNQRFTSMYTVCVPEFSWRYGKDANVHYSEHVKTLTAEWAKGEMEIWSKGFDEAHAFVIAQYKMAQKVSLTQHKRWSTRAEKNAEYNKQNKGKKGFKAKQDKAEPSPWLMEFAGRFDEHISTVAIADAGYDFFNPANVSNQTSLQQHLTRYGQEILRSQRNIDESARTRNDARNVDEAARDNTGRVRTPTTQDNVQRGGPEVVSGDDAGQAVSAKAKRLTQQQALRWLGDREGKAAESEAGFMYGDADVSLIVMKGTDGKATNEVRVMERGMPIAKFSTKAEAEAYVTGRLTGETPPRSVPERLRIGGKDYDVRAGVRALSKSSETVIGGGKMGSREGAFDASDNLFLYNFQPVKPSKYTERKGKPTVTPEQDAAYLRAIQDGDMDLAKALYMEVRAQSDYVSPQLARAVASDRKELATRHLKPRNKNKSDIWAFRNIGAAQQFVHEFKQSRSGGEIVKLYSRTGGVPDIGMSGWNTSSSPSGFFDMTNKDHVAVVQTYADAAIELLKKKVQDTSLDDMDRHKAQSNIDGINHTMDSLNRRHKNWTTIETATPLDLRAEGLPVFDGKNWIMAVLKDTGFIGHLESEGGGPATNQGSFEGMGIHDIRDVKSADPVTFDDNGNVIPLSQRFDPNNRDMRYQPPKDKYKPKVPVHTFASKSGQETAVFPNANELKLKGANPTSSSHLNHLFIEPDKLFSGRAQAHLKDLQAVVDSLTVDVGGERYRVLFQWNNNTPAGNFKGTIGVQIIPESILGDNTFERVPDGDGGEHVSTQYDTRIGDPIAYTDINYYPKHGHGYLSYASAVTRNSRKNTDGTINYDVPAEKVLKRIGINNPTRAQLDAMIDVVQGLGGLPYAEMAARLHSLGAGTKFDKVTGHRNEGLTGGVVNKTGSLFSARVRGYGKGSTEGTNATFASVEQAMTYFARRQNRWKETMGNIWTPLMEREFRDMINSAENFAMSNDKAHANKVMMFLQKYQPNLIEPFFGRVETAHDSFITDNVDASTLNRVDVDLRPMVKRQGDTRETANPDVEYEAVSMTKRGFLSQSAHYDVATTSYVQPHEAYQPIKWSTIDAQRKRALSKDPLYVTSMRGYSLMDSNGYSNAEDIKLKFNQTDRDILVRQIGLVIAGVSQSQPAVAKAFLQRIETIEKIVGKPINEIYAAALAANHKLNGRHTGGTTSYGSNRNSPSANFWHAVLYADFVEAIQPLLQYDAQKAGENASPDADLNFTNDGAAFGVISGHRKAGINDDRSNAYLMVRTFLGGTNNQNNEGTNDTFSAFPVVGPRAGNFESVTHGFNVMRHYVFEALLKGGMERHDARVRVRKLQDSMRFLETDHWNIGEEALAAAKIENAKVVRETLEAVGLGKLAESLLSIGEIDTHSMERNRNGGFRQSTLADLEPSVQYDAEGANAEATKVVTEAAKAAGLSLESIREALAISYGNVREALRLTSDHSGGDKDAVAKNYGPDSFQTAEINILMDKYGVASSTVNRGVHQTTPERSAKYFIDTVQERIDGLSNVLNKFKDGNGSVEGMLSTHLGLEAAEIQGLLGATFTGGSPLTAAHEKAQVAPVTKELKRLKKLRAQMLVEYTGGEVVSTKRKSLPEALKQMAKDGELQEVNDVMQLLRSYGIKRVSAAELMEYVRLSTDERGDLVNPDNGRLWSDMLQTSEGIEKASVPKQISEQRDFQLLMLLDGLSGLQAEHDPNTVSITDPSARGWAHRRGQFNVYADRGGYGYRTDGDMRTILEEHHHFLLQQNVVYKRLTRVMENIHPSGYEFKAEFEKAVASEHALLDRMMAEHDSGNMEAAVATLRSLQAGGLDSKALTPKQREGISEAIAASYVGGKAVLLLGELWMRALNQDKKYFEFAEGSEKFMKKEYPSSGPYATASDLLFNREITHSHKRKGDPSLNQQDRHYHGGMEKDYGFKSLVEFAAHALNDTNVQGVLSQMKPVVDANGKEPMAVAIETMRRSKNPTVKSYGERLSSVLASAKNLFDQLMSVVKVMIGFKQEANHRGMGTNATRADSRLNLASDVLRQGGQRTAMEQAIEAATLVLPRNKGPAPQMMADKYMAEAAAEGSVAINKTMKERKVVKYEATSGDFKDKQILEYLGRVDKSKSK